MNRNIERALLPFTGFLVFIGAIVVSAVHWSPAGSSIPAARPAFIPLLPGWFFFATLGLFVLFLIGSFTYFALTAIRGSAVRIRRMDDDTRKIVVMLILGLVFLLVMYVMFAFLISLFQFEEEDVAPPPLQQGDGEGELEQEELPPEPEPEPIPEEVSPQRDGSTRRILLMIAAGFLSISAALGVTRVVRRLLKTPGAEEQSLSERLVLDIRNATREILSRMLREPDHRLAVIAAYAMVEDILARHGYPRKPAQTPLEFMDEVIASLKEQSADQPDSIRLPEAEIMELTGLYEIAKFSDHPVGPDERRTAVNCLERIQSGIPNNKTESSWSTG
jgi:hypothetical protein